MTRFRIVAVGGEASFRPQVARALGAAPDAVGWAPSISWAERAVLDSGQPADLLVLAPSVTDEEALAVAQLMGRESPATAVVLVRDQPVDGAFPRLVRAGIRDVVDLSQGTAELEEALRRALDWSAGLKTAEPTARQTRGKIVSVFSTKGGTGKTFLACNLAAALAARAGTSIALLDLDHDLGDVFAYFNAEPRRTLHELISLEQDADAEAVTQLGTSLPGNVVGFGSPPDPRAEALAPQAVTKTLRALQEAFPFTVVDATSEYSDQVIATFDVSDIVCLIAALDVISIRHMSLGLQTLESLGVSRERFRVVLNRADSKVDLSPAEIVKILGVRVDAQIPSSPLVPRSINHGQLLFLEDQRSEVSKAIASFADRLYAQLTPDAPVAPEEKRRLWRKG